MTVYVCFAPKADKMLGTSLGPLSAINGLMHCANQNLYSGIRLGPLAISPTTP
jgi:hypothetical protein